MGMSKFHFIEREVGVINTMIEYERSHAGNDDELEDDDWVEDRLMKMKDFENEIKTKLMDGLY